MQSIEEYVESLRTMKGDKPAGDSLKRKTRKALELMSEILSESGHEVPDESDRAEYRRRSPNNEAGTDIDLSRIDRYFALPAEPELTEPEPTEPAERESTHELCRAGRKCLDTEHGEKRSEKLMLYITPTMIADIRDWCDLKHISCVSYITGLISADMEKKQETLRTFREFREKA